MPRYLIRLEYDGSPFHGWQIQGDGLPSVQGAILDALRRLGEASPRVCGAGRTDKGVHALRQAAHVDVERDWTPSRLVAGLNRFLPSEASAIEAARVADDFHARYDAVLRRYLYVLLLRDAPSALEARRAWRLPTSLDVDAMRLAARGLVGTRDFSTFRSASCGASSPIRSLERLDVEREGDRVSIVAESRSFLQTQARSMVGCLVEVGRRRWSVSEFADAARSCRRERCAPPAPPHGLYLADVVYGDEEQ